jgi:hypothetical protein
MWRLDHLSAEGLARAGPSVLFVCANTDNPVGRVASIRRRRVLILRSPHQREDQLGRARPLFTKGKLMNPTHIITTKVQTPDAPYSMRIR